MDPLPRDQITFGLPTADVRGTVLADICPVKVGWTHDQVVAHVVGMFYYRLHVCCMNVVNMLYMFYVLIVSLYYL